MRIFILVLAAVTIVLSMHAFTKADGPRRGDRWEFRILSLPRQELTWTPADRKEAFQTLDNNQDGVLTDADLLKVEDSQEEWSRMDRGKDGRISLAEFDDYYSQGAVCVPLSHLGMDGFDVVSVWRGVDPDYVHFILKRPLE